MRASSVAVSLAVLAVSLELGGARAQEPCSLVNFLPYSDASQETDIYYNEILNTTALHTPLNHEKLGFDYTATILLAMDHVNRQDASVVPDLEACSFQFSPNTTRFINAKRDAAEAFQAMLDVAKEPQGENSICAILGPFFEESIDSVLELGETFEVPHIIPATDFRNTMPHSTLNTVSFTTTDVTLSEDVIMFLKLVGISYVAIVHYSNDKRERMATHMQSFALEHNFLAELFEIGSPPPRASRKEFFETNIQRIIYSGIRTIVILYSDAQDYLALAEYMDTFDMLDGEFTFVFMKEGVPPHDVNFVFGDVPNDHPIHKMLAGGFVVTPLDGYDWKHTGEDAFLNAWRDQDPSRVALIDAALPYESSTPSDYFATSVPYTGSSFLFDSIVSIALGTCLSQGVFPEPPKPDPSTRKGPPPPKLLPVVSGMISHRFEGASGIVYTKMGTKNPLQRTDRAGVYNLQRQNDGSYKSVLVAMRDDLPDTKDDYRNIRPEGWTMMEEAVFSNNLPHPPVTQLYIENDNMLTPWTRNLGLLLFALAWAQTMFLMIAVSVWRKKTVMKAAQPVFLQLLSFGCLLTSSSIFTLSLDEEWGWSNPALSRACMATPWLFFLGLVTIYTALLGKMWRLDRLMRRKFTRGPLLVIPIISTVVLLTAWSLHDPWRWERAMISYSPPESYGKCTSPSFGGYAAALVATAVITSFFAVRLAFKLRDVTDILSDVKSTSYAFMAHLQAWLVALPILFAVGGDGSANGIFLGRILLVFVFGISTNSIVIIPKLIYILTTSEEEQSSGPFGQGSTPMKVESAPNGGSGAGSTATMEVESSPNGGSGVGSTTTASSSDRSPPTTARGGGTDEDAYDEQTEI